MIIEYADQIHSINVEAILRDGIARYSDQQGRLWNALARYYVHLGMFAGARNIYDQAIHTVKTKKDFVEVWEAYTRKILGAFIRT
jgi:pre-mRNA-splicing factor SYF1